MCYKAFVIVKKSQVATLRILQKIYQLSLIGLLARIPIDLPDRMPDYGLITRLGEPPTPAAQAFMAVLLGMAGLGVDGV